MLIRFNFQNFKSFKNENILDMEALPLKEHEYNILKLYENINLLKVAAIYGANASGKTNVLKAFCYMKNKILISDDSQQNSLIEDKYTFMLNNKPISLQVEILAKNGKIYKYGFEILKDKIISEWLFEKTSNKFNTIMERTGRNVLLNISDQEEIYNNVDEKTLFLNVYKKINNVNIDFKNVFEWFVNAHYLDLGNPNFEKRLNHRNSLEIINNKKYKNELLKFIKLFDFGIEGLQITPIKINDTDINNLAVKLEFQHKTEDNKLKLLPLSMESNGTIKLLHLFDFFMTALKNGSVLFIDELDAKLHPLLTRYVINMFHNSEINVGNGQLIYSTHDTTNLNQDTFRRDEIWFTEKTSDGISEIYSLSDYILDDNIRYNKDYLTGRFGAIPIFNDFEVLNEK